MKRSWALVFAGALALSGCSGEDGGAGPQGAIGPTGPQGPTGPVGPVGPGAPIPAGAGIQMTVQSVTIPADNRPEVTLAFADAQGNAIDFLTELAAGTFGSRGPRFVLSELTAAGDYNSLYEGSTARPSSFPATAPIATIAAMYTPVSEGVVRFKFPTAIAAGVTVTPAATHTVGVWATRTVDGVNYPQTVTYDFVPAGGTPSPRAIAVADAACNACHSNMQAHGTRRTVKMCAVCHYPGWNDSGTGTSATVGADANFVTMVHKLHSNTFTWGAESIHVVMPVPNSAKNCVACHASDTAWKNPTDRVACTSCHTAIGSSHGSTNACSMCHDAASIELRHSAKYDAATNTTFAGKKLDVTIDAIDVTSAAAPVITFTVKVDDAGYDAKATPLASLRFTISGPTSDYGSAFGGVGYTQSASFAGSGGAALLTPTSTAGQFTAALPDLSAMSGKAIGVGVEAYIAEVGTCSPAPCTAASKSWNASYVAPKYVTVGSATHASANNRRLITDNAKCNACHQELGFHSNSSRKGPEYCAMCHHPNNVNDERTTRLEGTTFTPESVSIMNMAHKLHAGSALSADYALGADRSLSKAAPNADTTYFNGAFPGDLGDCQLCHRAGTYGLPKATNLGTLSATYTCNANAADADNFCDVLAGWPLEDVNTAGADTWTVDSFTIIPPQTAACTGCHDSPASKAHAELNTSASGVEACEVCHGNGATWSALEVHVPAR